MFPQINSAFIFIFLATVQFSAGWFFQKPVTTAAPEYKHVSKPMLPPHEKTDSRKDLVLSEMSTTTVSPDEAKSFEYKPYSAFNEPYPPKFESSESYTDEPAPTTTTSTTPPTTTPTTTTTTPTDPPSTSLETTSTSTVASETLEGSPSDTENNFAVNDTSSSSKNESKVGGHSFRNVDHDADSNSGSGKSDNGSESNFDDDITTTPTLQGNETVSANVTILDNSVKTSTKSPVSEDSSVEESIARDAAPRAVQDSNKDEGSGYTPVLLANETVTTENVTSKVTTTSPSTASPLDSIDSVARRVNRNSANSIGSNQLLPILFTLLISQIF